MGNIEITSASAGTGKTYYLADLLRKELEEGDTRPDGILATTFTRKAAAELVERTRTFLLKVGLIDQANMLSTSRIGTVNSVCGELISEFSFSLGLPPEPGVLDESASNRMLLKAVTDVVAEEDIRVMADLQTRMREFDWQKDVHRIVQLARSNLLDADDLKGSIERNKQGIRDLLETPVIDANELDGRLAEALSDFIESYDDQLDTTKKTKTAVSTARFKLSALNRGIGLSWGDWHKLTKLEAGKKTDETCAGVREVASLHLQHSQLHADLHETIERIIKLSAGVIEAYQYRKRERGVVDFGDQESYALQLLKLPEVIEKLEQELDLVLVDEFQDTNPIQLAIFLKLAGIARRSVWVGDQKQSVFGFRGTDPSLMDAAIESLLEAGESPPLPFSYRSRPELVDITSDLFAGAFSPQGIPEHRVRISAREDFESDIAGPAIERWMLNSKNITDDASALAASVQQMLDDPSVTVRDRKSSEVRQVRAGDVAVLCRTNEKCQVVAAALQKQGVSARLRQDGLIKTPEAILVLAGIRLWIDPDDLLAAAEIARLVEYPTDRGQWLNELLADNSHDKLRSLTSIERVIEARESNLLAGSVGVYDAVVEAIGVRELCLRWGDSDYRLANLDVLRGYVLRFVESALDAGEESTVTGLLAHLDSLAETDYPWGGLSEDLQAVHAGGDAVEVSTWHRAKGLEWPVTLLFDLSKDLQARVLGAQIVSDSDTIQMDDPLAGRWIQYWPNPYSRSQRSTKLDEQLQAHSFNIEAEQREERETLRLLYVGWTRARDRLVLVTREGEGHLNKGMLSLLQNNDGVSLLTDTDEGQPVLCGNNLDAIIRRTEPVEPEVVEIQPGCGYVPPGPREHPPAIVYASSIESTGKAEDPVEIGPRIELDGTPDFQKLGNAVHGFLGADLPGLDPAVREQMADGLLRGWEVDEALRTADLLRVGDALQEWIGSRWPTATWHREWPLQGRQTDGSICKGIADLVLETDKGFIIIDHKSYPGDRKESIQKAESFAGQLAAYADIIARATGKPILGTFIHMPISGLIIPIS